MARSHARRPRVAHPLRVERLEPRDTPAVFVVTTTADAGPGSLREAVALANDEAANPGADTIQFAPALFGQTVTLTTVGDTSFEPSALAITSAVTLDGWAGYTRGPGVTIAAARSPGLPEMRLFYVAPAAALTLDGLTLTGGVARGGSAEAGGGGGGFGGAIFNRGILSITRCLLTDNVAIGGMTTWRGQYATSGGGGVNGGASNGDGGFGGGGNAGYNSVGRFDPWPIYSPPGPGHIGGFGGGGGGGGGGAWDAQSDRGSGPGGFGAGRGGGGSYETYAHGTQISNPGAGGAGAGLGGAVFNHGGVVTIADSTFAGNGAYGGTGAFAWMPVNPGQGLGGGLFNLNGTVAIAHSTFSGNAGGAVYVLAHDASGGVGNANPATLTLLYSVLADSVAGPDLTANQLDGSGGAGVNFGGGTGAYSGYRYYSMDFVETSSWLGGAQFGSNLKGWLTGDTQLGSLAWRGGPTRTVGGFGIDIGGEVPAGWPTTDQRGFPRMAGAGTPYGTWTDLGAVEVQPPPPLVVARPPAGAGDTELLLFDPTTRTIVKRFAPFPGFGGGVDTAVGDVTGDGVADIVAAAGAGGGPLVKVFDGATLAEVSSFYAYAESFTGGVSVAVGDVTGDGELDVVTGAGFGGGPHVKVFDGVTLAEVRSFYAYDERFTGGVSVAAGDVDGDGSADVITGAGPGGGPHVKAFDARTLAEVRSFYAFDPNFTGGVRVAAAVLTFAGVADILAAAGPGAGPHVLAFSPVNGGVVVDHMAFDEGFAGGVSVTAADVNGDRWPEVVVAAGPGLEGPPLRAFAALGGGELPAFFPSDEVFPNGAFVG